MAQNREIGELGQIVTVDTSANSMTVNGSIILGNSSSNVVINSTAISFGGITQTDRSFTWTNTHTFTNTVSIAALSANGSLGLSSQVLTTNGTGIYWSSAGVNVNATYTWSNVHTFNANLILSTATAISANGSYGLSGQALVTNGTGVYWSSVATNTDSQYTWSNTQTFSNTITFNSVINGTANAANYLGNSSGTIANVSSWITSNASAAYTNSVSYTDGKILTANSAITGNAATAYTNAVSYTDGKILTANSAITGNAATAYTNATIFASNASNINSGTLAEARLPYRMDQNVRTTDTVTLGNLTLTGNLYVGSNVNVIGANNLSVVDNMIYLNANNTVANPDLGFAGNYNDGVYHHAGFFRDASDSGTWKVFDNYLPEPDANSYIDTTNTTFHLANFQANTLNAGNTSTNWFIANTAGAYLTGAVNAASYTVGTSFTANATVVNAVSFYAGTTLIGNTTGPYGKTEGSLNVNSALTANNSTNLGGTAAASYQLNSTLNANIASYLPTYTGVVNGSSYSVGTSFTANSTVVNAVSYYSGTTLIANTTGPYGKTEGNLNVNSATYATSAGSATNASAATNATNASNLGGTSAASYALKTDTHYIGTTSVALNRASAALALTGITSIDGSAASATNATYATSAGSATNATSAGSATNATYATSAGSATNATSAGSATNATYATSAGSATNATSAGSATNATYATSAGSATNATTSTNASYVGTRANYQSATGTALTFGSIPSTVKRITVMYYGLSLNGSDYILCQLGTSGGFTSSGYIGFGTSVTNGQGIGGFQFSNGFGIYNGWTGGGYAVSGSATITNLTGNYWCWQSTAGADVTQTISFGGGGVGLAATLTQIRLLPSSTNSFDAGIVNIMYD